jgi:aspartate carbamoyltransferase regulatory subunit
MQTGCKGMIKISDKFFCDEEINRIALMERLIARLKDEGIAD